MDSKLADLINKEVGRQEFTINLIPSENVADPEMLEILSSPLVNKYSEGYPGKRYYPGNKIYDEIENLAKARALKAFGLSSKGWAVNVQAYSGSPANQAIYFALLRTRINANQNADKRGKGVDIMGLSLSHGGHLTHGHLINFSGIQYQSLPYELDLKTGRIDYSYLEKLAREYSPKIIVSGATAYPRKIDFKRIGKAAKKAGAYMLADISHIAGLVAAGLHPSPFDYADVVMTTTHKTLRGPRGALIFARKSPRKFQASNNKLQSNYPSKADLRPKRMRLGSTPRVGKLTIADAIDRAVFPGLQGGPHNNQTAAIAWAMNEVKTDRFREYQIQVVKNARILSKELTRLGFSLISGGTDNHLMLLDLRRKKITGSDAEKKLEASGIIANRNSVPGDKKPFRPTGIRIGTPYITSRGMKEKEMRQIARMIYSVLVKKKKIKEEVQKLCMQFPLPY